MIYDFEIWLIKFEAGLYFSTIDAEIQYIAIGCQMGWNFQILIWTACANIATHCSFYANTFSTEKDFQQPDFCDQMAEAQIRAPLDPGSSSRGTNPWIIWLLPLFPWIADCFYDCFFHLLIAFRRLSTCFCLVLMFYLKTTNSMPLIIF